MAHQIPFREANMIMKAPPGGAYGNSTITGIEICRCAQDADLRFPVCISRWMFTDAEMEELKRNGGKFYLLVAALRMQPVKLCVEHPGMHIGEDPYRDIGV